MHPWFTARRLLVFIGVLIYLKVPGMAVAALDKRIGDVTTAGPRATGRVTLGDTGAETTVVVTAEDGSSQSYPLVIRRPSGAMTGPSIRPGSRKSHSGFSTSTPELPKCILKPFILGSFAQRSMPASR